MFRKKCRKIKNEAWNINLQQNSEENSEEFDKKSDHSNSGFLEIQTASRDGCFSYRQRRDKSAESSLAKEGKPPTELENLSALNDEETVMVILSEIKKRKDSIAQYSAGGREELAKKEAAELEILKKYVPE